ncbi:accessory gland protein Acp76A-like, partial [Drosophila persimilis]|uniref:accessory gland protein Acp76A-like n=1 Tax=Drosophila persimilis TaxID=7234 RepID=UPI000F095988
ELGKRYEKATNAQFRMPNRLFFSNVLPGIAIRGISVNVHWRHRHLFKILHMTPRDLWGQNAHSLCVAMMHSLNIFATMTTDNARGIFITFNSSTLQDLHTRI